MLLLTVSVTFSWSKICNNNNVCSFQKENLYKEVLYTITHKLGGSIVSATQYHQVANHLIQLQQQKPNALSAALAPLWQSVHSGHNQQLQEQEQQQTQQQHLSKEELLVYSQKAFDIDDETHQRLMEEASDDKVS